MSNGVFNFNFLALVFSEILADNFFTQSEYFTISNCVFNFNIQALVVSEILGGLKFMLGGPVPPVRILVEKILHPSTLLCLMAFLIVTF